MKTQKITLCGFVIDVAEEFIRYVRAGIQLREAERRLRKRTGNYSQSVKYILYYAEPLVTLDYRKAEAIFEQARTKLRALS